LILKKNAYTKKAREQEFGDWNYPVITAHEPSRERWLTTRQNVLVAPANRTSQQPITDNDVSPANNRRKVRQETVRNKKQKEKNKSASVGSGGQAPQLGGMPTDYPSTSSSSKSSSGESANHVRKHTAGKEIERHDALEKSKVDGNEGYHRQFIQNYEQLMGEEPLKGFESSSEAGATQSSIDEFTVGEDEDEAPAQPDSPESRKWVTTGKDADILQPKFNLEGEEFENVWSGGPARSL